MIHGAFVLSLFPLLALVIYLFASSRAVRAAATTQAELDDIEDDGPLTDQAKGVWITFAVFSVASLLYTVYDIGSEYLESRKKIQEKLRESGKETWGTIKTTVSATRTLKEMGKQRASRRRLMEKKAHDTKLRRVLSQTMSRRSSLVGTKEDDDDQNTVKIEMTTMNDSVDTKALSKDDSADVSPVRFVRARIAQVLIVSLKHNEYHCITLSYRCRILKNTKLALRARTQVRLRLYLWHFIRFGSKLRVGQVDSPIF